MIFCRHIPGQFRMLDGERTLLLARPGERWGVLHLPTSTGWTEVNIQPGLSLTSKGCHDDLTPGLCVSAGYSVIFLTAYIWARRSCVGWNVSQWAPALAREAALSSLLSPLSRDSCNLGAHHQDMMYPPGQRSVNNISRLESQTFIELAWFTVILIMKSVQ